MINMLRNLKYGSKNVYSEWKHKEPKGNYIIERHKLKIQWIDLIANYTELRTKLDIGSSSEDRFTERQKNEKV